MSWDNFATASMIDPGIFLFMGADPAWTPARETKLPDAPDAGRGHCLLCGGDGVPLASADGEPIVDQGGHAIVVAAIVRGSRRVCARCMRDGRGSRSQAAPGVEVIADEPEIAVACEDDPGYVERDGVKVPERFSRLMNG